MCWRVGVCLAVVPDNRENIYLRSAFMAGPLQGGWDEEIRVKAAKT